MKKEGEIRIPSGCAIAGVISRSGERINGKVIVDGISAMRERSNGLGGGFAGYGVYPEYKDFYAFHIFFDDETAKKDCEEYLKKNFDIVSFSAIPVKKTKGVTDEPFIYRYFVLPRSGLLVASDLSEKEYVAKSVTKINSEIKGAYVFGSGKNVGVFKGVGYPEDIADYYMLENYDGYLWTAHGRYPTNTPGWWGGAHPFSFLDISVVHNGEISSYDANRRYTESFGYKCNLLTDTEVIAYIVDYLTRKKGLTFEEVACVVASPFWSNIDKMTEEKKKLYEYLRYEFSSSLITGPFSVLVGFDGGVMALNDRLKLRSMVVAEKGDRTYFASEECAIRKMEENPDRIWSPKGGEPVVVRVDKV